MTVIIPDPEEGLSQELVIQRQLTVAFILTQPVEITLVPREKVKKPAGGFGWADQAPRPPQTMRLIEPGTIPRPVVTVDGIQREVEFELLGEWNATIGRFDTFSHDGARWEVVEVAHFNGWEQRALVSKVG